MNELIPLMVIVPLMAALLISAFSKFNTITKIFAFVVAICLPIIPLLSNYGLHYFGGYEPMINDAVKMMYHPAITYSFTFLQQIFIGAVGLLTFLVIFIYLTKYRKVSGPYLFLLFLGTAAVTAMILTDDIFHMFVFFEILALAQVGIVAASSIDYSYEMALKYMVLGSIGSPMMLLGIGFLLALTGSVNFSSIFIITRINILWLVIRIRFTTIPYNKIWNLFKSRTTWRSAIAVIYSHFNDFNRIDNV